MSDKAICYYVSGHGLGHASRACQVMSSLPNDVRLIVKTRAPEDFIRRESGRLLEYVKAQFDAGTWQASNISIDWPRSLEEAAAIQARANETIEAEAEYLRRERVGVVVADIPPPPLAAAARAGIPGVAVANFTWVEIFRNQARHSPIAAELVRRYQAQYQTATCLLRTRLSFEMPYFPKVQNIPLIARTGTSCRERLDKDVNVPPGNRLVLLYFGGWSNDEMQLGRLKNLQGYTFVAFNRLPPPIHFLDPDKWHFPDVVDTADVVLAKPGYGTLGECMANGTPVVYYPRPEFAEYPVLRRALLEWGGAVQMSRSDLLACRWERSLAAAVELRPPKVDATGADAAAREILRIIR